MVDYKKMYFALFNAVTTAINQLQDAQRKGESEYIEAQDISLTILPTSTDDETKTTKNRKPPNKRWLRYNPKATGQTQKIAGFALSFLHYEMKSGSFCII